MKNNYKEYTELSWKETNDPETIAQVTVSKNFNLSNYKQAEDIMKLANLLAIGGTAVMLGIKHKLRNLELVNHYQLAQLEYVLSKNYQVKQWLRKTARVNGFKTFGDARKYFSTSEWAAAKEENKWKVNVIDIALLPTLMDEREKYLVELDVKEQRRYLSMLWVDMLRVEGLKELVKREDLLKDLPNQQVTAAIAPSIEVQQRIGEDGPYISYKGDYENRYAQEIEAKIVNAWFYNNEAFRVQSLDDLVDELETLREWFEQYKYNARRNGVTKPQAAIVEKFERLQFLEIEVGTYLEERLREYSLAGGVDEYEYQTELLNSFDYDYEVEEVYEEV